MAESEENLGLDASDYFRQVDEIIQKNRRWQESLQALARQHGVSADEITKAAAQIEDFDLTNILQQQSRFTQAVNNTNRALEEQSRLLASQRAGGEITAAAPGGLRNLNAELDKLKKSTSDQAATFESRLLKDVDSLTARLDSQATVQEKINEKVAAQAALRERGLRAAQAQLDADRQQGRVFGGNAPQRAQGGTATTFPEPSPNGNRILRERLSLVDDANLRLNAEVKYYDQLSKLEKIVAADSLKTADAGKKVVDATTESANQAQRLHLTWQNVSRIVQAQLLHTVIGLFVGELRNAVDQSRQFQIKISEIRTISQSSQQSFDAWANSVRGLSDQFGKPILDVAAGTYEAISNQIAKGAETADFMAKALRFAQVAVTSTENSVNLLSSVINAYQLNVQDADRISAQLFKTIDLGRVRADDLANTFGRIAPLASQLGVQLEELNAAIALITIQGIKPAESLTAINGIMNQLLKPTKELKGLFKEWGVSTGQAAIQTFGFDGVLRKLLQAVESGRVTFEGVVDEIRARRGLTPLIRSLDDYDSILKKIRDGSQAEFIAASKIINESAGQQFTIEMNKVKNIFTADFGGPFIAALVNIGKITGSLIGQTDNLSGAFRGLVTIVNTGAAAWLSYKVAMNIDAAARLFLAQIAAIRLEVAATAVPLNFSTAALIRFRTAAAGLVGGGLGIAAVITAAAFAWQKHSEAVDQAARDFDESQQKIRESVTKTTEEYNTNLDKQNQTFRNAMEDRFKIYAQANARINANLNQLAEAEIKNSKRVSRALQDSFDLFAKASQKAINQLEKDSNTAIRNIEKAQDTLFTLQENLTSGRFDKQIKILPEPEQVTALFKRIQELQFESTQKLLEKAPTADIASKNREESEKLAKEAERLYNKILTIQSTSAQKHQEAIEKLNELNEKVGANRGIREDKDNLAELNRQQAALNALRKKGDAQGLAFAKIALQEQLEQARNEESGRREDLSEDKLRQQIAEKEAILAKTGDQAAIEAQIEAFHQAQVDALQQYIAANQQIADQAKAKEETERKNLETLRTQFAEITKFKLPDTFDPKKLTDSIQEFDKLVSGAGITDQSVLLSLAQKRAELEKQANLEIQKHHQDLIEQGLASEKERRIKIESDILARQRTANETRQSGLTQLPELVKELKDIGNSGIFLRSLGAGVEKTPTFKNLENAINAFESHQNAGTAEAVRKALEPLIQIITQEKLGSSASDVVVKRGFGSDDRTLQDVIQNVNDALRNVQGANIDLAKTQKDRAQFEKAVGAESADAFKNATGSVNDFARALDGAVFKLQGLSGPQVEHKMFGWYARGPDRIPAMLSPGEFIVRASQARKYYDLLNRINSGSPLYFNEGGVVPPTYNFERRISQNNNSSNYNFGGIAVTVNAAGGPVDPVAIAKGIQAAARRGEVIFP